MNKKLKITNTLSNRLEIFEPQSNKKITMYVCGPTVYDNPHIGNGRAIVVYDLLFRILKKLYKDHEVIYARNITDIDDKIITRAAQEEIDPFTLTKRVTESFHEDCSFIGCISPSFEPKASDHIGGMLNIIDKLIENGSAYYSSGHVYFLTSSFKDIGKLAGRELDKLRAGARVEIDPNKRHPEDFVLWKPSPDNEIGFDSKWGRGRPGWHIECSAMSHEFLGQDFDIHGGGADLMFPHHTNEIAQSCAAFPGSKYADYWVHNGFVTSEGEKMSKSLGNFITIKDLRDKGVKGEALRMLLLSANYRAPLDYSAKLLQDITSNIDYLYRALRDFSEFAEVPFEELPSEFTDSLLDDLNTSKAFAHMLHMANNLNKSKSQMDANLLWSCGRLFGIFSMSSEEWFKPGFKSRLKPTMIGGGANNIDLIESMIDERKEAKLAKNWQEADRIRATLLEMGITLEDKPDGTTLWEVS